MIKVVKSPQLLLFVLIILLYKPVFGQKGTLKDKRDGKTYKTLNIYGKTWMTENLNYKSKDSWVYDNKEENAKKYGRLYTWEAAKKACPAGWHLPTRKEWADLMYYSGGYVGTRDKAFTVLYQGGSSGFNVYVAKYDYLNEDWSGESAIYWSSTYFSKEKGTVYFAYFNKDMKNSDPRLDAEPDKKLSVRCVKDEK